MGRLADIKSWISRHEPRARATNAKNEVMFPCPSCGHKAHYFNVFKGVGYCFAARCQRVSTLDKLEEIWGEVGKYSLTPDVEEALAPTISLPEGCQPLVEMENGKYFTKFPEAVAALEKDRFINVIDAYMFSIQVDTQDERLVIPVVDCGKLVNYVSRAAWWCKSKTDYKRYLYAKGADTGSYFFNFQAIPQKAHVVIVENTFNAIWLRHYFPCTSSFGSHLGKEQIAKLVAKGCWVTIMWDQGAEPRAREACSKLRNNGIRAEYVIFKAGKQPDNYSSEVLQQAYKASTIILGRPQMLKGIEVG